jgi:hypothetical protein
MACTTEYAIMLAAATAFAGASAALAVEIGSVAGTPLAPATIILVVSTGAAFIKAREDVKKCLEHSGLFSSAERMHDETQQLEAELNDLQARANV